jgi:hypothetical protein
VEYYTTTGYSSKVVTAQELITAVTVEYEHRCKGNLTDLRRILHLSLAKGNPK